MLEELLPHKFATVRRLRNSEKTLVRRILEQQASDNTARRTCLDSLDVQEMSDGGMGSLCFPWPGKEARARRFRRRIAEIQFDDVDGVLVVASLSADQEGELLEFDIWRTDFKPVTSLSPESQ
jgi:hypothetical protein